MRLGYGRCSTDEQADALQAQLLRLTQAGCDEILSDLESGTNDERPGLQQVMALVMAGKVTELLVTRVDRLGRHAAYADQLLALCSLKGVTVRALDGGEIETATPQGFFMARTMTTLAEMESRMLSMRLKKQFTVYRQQGRHLRRRKPFGYMGGPEHKLVPNPDEWDQALRVLDELRRYGSFSRTAMHLPSWCSWTPAASSLQAWFCNPVIRGHVGHHLDKHSGKGWRQAWGEIYYDQHEALISEADWQALADSLRRTKNNFAGKPTVEARHGLTGLLVCDSCGHRMRRNSSVGVVWWRCRHRLCTARGGIKESLVFPLVIDACVNAAQKLAAVAAAPPDDDPRIALKRRDLEALQSLAARNPGLLPGCKALEQEIEAMQRRPAPSVDLVRYQQMMSDPKFFTGATADQQRAIYGAVLQELRVGPGGHPVMPVLRSF
jgi:DNA invertase Pin-like site-specific DNA recombinase